MGICKLLQGHQYTNPTLSHDFLSNLWLVFYTKLLHTLLHIITPTLAKIKISWNHRMLWNLETQAYFLVFLQKFREIKGGFKLNLSIFFLLCKYFVRATLLKDCVKSNDALNILFSSAKISGDPIMCIGTFAAERLWKLKCNAVVHIGSLLYVTNLVDQCLINKFRQNI